MTAEIDDRDPLEETVAGAVTALTFLVGFGLLALGVPYFWVAFPVGFGGVLPMAMGAARRYRTREAGGTEDDALATLQDRYARGELTEAEFERQVERLLETDDDHATPDRTGERERELE